MLSSMVKEHGHEQLKKKEEIEKKRQGTLNAANKFCDALVENLNNS